MAAHSDPRSSSQRPVHSPPNLGLDETALDALAAAYRLILGIRQRSRAVGTESPDATDTEHVRHRTA
jgi:hypothetical protein